MTPVLGGTLVFKVMIIGRWSSNAFIYYIRSQAIEFLIGNFSKRRKMISKEEYFVVPKTDNLQARWVQTLYSNTALREDNRNNLGNKYRIGSRKNFYIMSDNVPLTNYES